MKKRAVENNNEQKTFYIIKWWKSKGIFKFKTNRYDEKYVTFKPDGSVSTHLELKKDAFETLQEAFDEIDKIRLKRVDSFKKQIKKLEKLDPFKMQIRVVKNG